VLNNWPLEANVYIFLCASKRPVRVPPRSRVREMKEKEFSGAQSILGTSKKRRRPGNGGRSAGKSEGDDGGADSGQREIALVSHQSGSARALTFIYS
jgi:hypothetical protein